jgi:hypothetical protein
MSFVPFSAERALITEKHQLRKMLEHLGITHPAYQKEFMSALLGKPFDSQKLSRQDVMDLKRSIMKIQREKDQG